MEISPEIARECMDNFDAIMQGNDLEKIKASYSNSVTFLTPGFAEWITSNAYLTKSVKIQICFGIYTENAARELKRPEYANRLTAFVWPVKENLREQELGGDPIVPDPDFAPFNLGDLKP